MIDAGVAQAFDQPFFFNRKHLKTYYHLRGTKYPIMTTTSMFLDSLHLKAPLYFFVSLLLVSNRSMRSRLDLIWMPK